MRRVDSALRRHDLVWLDEVQWRNALLAPLPDDWRKALGGWFARGRPAVVRRQESAAPEPRGPCEELVVSKARSRSALTPERERTEVRDDSTQCRNASPQGQQIHAPALSLGVALPPSRGKLKIPFFVARSALLRCRPPVTLEQARRAAPPEWQPALEVLLGAARGLDTPLSVYGSLAWQYLSGEAYLTASSDVDLVWRAKSAEQLAAMLELLARWQKDSGISADGEVLFPDDSAVAWKELAAKPRQLLIKWPAGVELRTTEDLLTSLAA